MTRTKAPLASALAYARNVGDAHITQLGSVVTVTCGTGHRRRFGPELDVISRLMAHMEISGVAEHVAGRCQHCGTRVGADVHMCRLCAIQER